MRKRVHALPIDAANVRQLFEYVNGRLHWKSKPSAFHRMVLGSPAGTINGNYRIIRFCRVGMYEHRLVWLYHHGDWPVGEIDHINGDGMDNRIENLRCANRFENAQNVRDLITNKIGIRGVCYIQSRQKYRATIRANGKCTTIGYFETAEQARLAYVKARSSLHPQHQPRPAKG